MEYENTEEFSKQMLDGVQNIESQKGQLIPLLHGCIKVYLTCELWLVVRDLTEKINSTIGRVEKG